MTTPERDAHAVNQADSKSAAMLASTAVAPLGDVAHRRRGCHRTPRRRVTPRAASRGDLEDALSRARERVRENFESAHALWGDGEHLGMPAKWYLRVDGEAFVEETMNAELCYVSGRAKGRRGECWELDFSGHAQSLDLDDAEAAALMAWVRSGYWVSEECLGDYLDVEMMESENVDECVLGLKLRTGKVTSRLTLDADTFLPKEYAVALCGDEDVWKYDEWTVDASGVVYPAVSKLYGTNGGVQVYRVKGLSVGRSKEGRSIFEKPQTPSPMIRFDPQVESKVKTSYASSAHVLVEPVIDGEKVGPFILDTGASGLVITPRAAKALGLRGFGEVHVSGVSGRIPAVFRRGKELRLGPLILDKPVFMEMSLDGIVSGSKKPVAGIIGFDAFKSAILAVSEGGKSVDIYCDSTSVDENWAWQDLRLVSNVPHIAATFSGVDDAQKSQPNIFMIDSGAGGADVIFHSKAVEALGLANMLGPMEKRISSRVRGVSGANGEDAGATMTYRTTMDWLELADKGANGESVRFEEIDTLLAYGPGFSLSEHSCGMICARLLGKKQIVYDFPRRRVAFNDS